MSPAPARHRDTCDCVACLDKRKQQYHADMDGASHWAIRATAPDQVEAGIDLSLRFLQPKLDEIAALKRQLAERDRILLAILHATEDLNDDIQGETWPDEIYGDALAKLKALADADAERRGMR